MAFDYKKLPLPLGIKFDFDLPGWEVLADQVLGGCTLLHKRNKIGPKSKLTPQNTLNLDKYKSFILKSEKGMQVRST